MSQQNNPVSLDKNKANTAGVATVGGVGIIGTVIWQVVAQIWPSFTPTPEEVIVVAALAGGVTAWLGAYLAKHNINIPGVS